MSSKCRDLTDPDSKFRNSKSACAAEPSRPEPQILCWARWGTQPCFPPAAEGSPSEQRTEQGAFPWGSRRKDCSTQKPAGSPWQLALHGHTSEKPGLSRASLCWFSCPEATSCHPNTDWPTCPRLRRPEWHFGDPRRLNTHPQREPQHARRKKSPQPLKRPPRR